MINIKNWNAYNRLKPVVSAARGTILANPVAAGTGLAAGGVFGLATSNEGRGPLGNAAFWAPVGLGLGVGAMGLRPHMVRAAGQSREMLDFLQRAPKSWKGSAANSSEVTEWVERARMAAKTNPGMGPISNLYQGFTGTPDTYLARRATLTNDEMVGRAYGFLRGQFGIAGEGPLSAAQLSAAAPDAPEWMKTAMSLSADLGLSKSPRVGMRTASAENFTGASAKWDWDSIVGMIETHGDSESLRGDFLKGLGTQMRSLSEGWEGGLSARDIGNRPSRAKMNLEFNHRVTADMLESQGQKGLARQVRKLHAKFKKGVTITGIINREISASQNEITGLLVQMADLPAEMALELDVPNKFGIIRHGRYGQNIHVPRNIIDVRSIKALYDGSLAKNLKPHLQGPASFVLQNLKSYEPDTGSDLVDWLKRTYQRATSWETQPYRADRAGLESAHTMAAIERGQVPLFMQLRMQSAMIALPTNEAGNPLPSLLKRVGIPSGDSGPINFMGQLQGMEVPDWLATHGLFTSASENQARSAVFSQVLKLAELDPGVIEHGLSKASILERDVAKPYRLGFNESMGETAIEKARKVAWVPFATEKMRGAADAYEQGFLMGLNPVFESEANLMRKLAFERNRKVAYRVFRSAAIDKSKWRMLFSNIAKIGEINEGVIATAAPEALEMAGSRLLEFDLLNKNILAPGETYKDLVGKNLSQGDYIGLDLSTGEMVGHTYTNREQGRATITESMTRIDPKTKKEKIIVRIEERYPGQEAKVGTAATKSYMKNIEEEAVPEISKLMNFLRGRVGKAGHAKMYGNQPILPVLSSLSAGGNAVAGFALQSSMYKFHNRFSTMFTNLLVKHMPEMTPLGQNMIMSDLKKAGVNVRRIRETGMFEATFKGQAISSMEEGQAVLDKLFSGKDRQGLLRRVYTSMYNRPTSFFRKGQGPMSRLSAGVASGRWSFPAGGMKRVGWKHIQAFEMMTGFFTQAKMWDTLENNIPGQASITMHELESLQQYGLKNTWQEIVGRSKRSGGFQTTRKMFGALAEMGNNRGFLSEKALQDIGIAKFTLDDVSLISKIDPAMGFRQSADMPWRGLGQFGDNFVVDLTTAHGTMENAGRAVQEALGTSRIFVPGTQSDIWGVEYVLGTGRRLSTEAFVDPLEKTLKSVTQHFSQPDNKQHLVNAQHYYRQYLSSISDMSKILYTGRGGGVKDASGLWATGRMTFRPYRSIFGKALGEDLASSVIGLSPKKYSSLTRKMMRETGAGTLEELVERGHAVSRGGHTFLVGSSIRYPITDAGPVLFAMDKSLRRGGIGTEETYRYIKNADFDGDSIVCRIMMDRASVSELFGALTDPNSPAFKRYHEALRISDIFGGASQDIRRMAEAGTSESLYGKFMERLGKFKPMMSQDVMERMGKAWTGGTGWYSNLSKVLAFMTDVDGLSETERFMRARIGMEIQQKALDFGKSASLGAKAVMDPSALARVMGQAWQLAGKAPASAEGGGNELMRGVFEGLGFFESFSEKMAASGGTQEDIAMLKRLTENWFSTVTPEGRMVDMNQGLLSERSEMMDSLLKRGLRREKLEEAMGEFINDQRVRAAAGEAGWIHAPGRMPKAGEMLSEINDITKNAVAGSARILKNVWQRFRGSPEAQAAGTVLAGAGLLAAGIGLTSSPTEYEAPGYGSSKSASAIMRSPDVAMAGSSGEAPLPGSRGGHVASSMAPTEVPRYTKGVQMQHKRFYYDQSNRTPRTTSYAATSPEEASFRASEQGDDMYRSSRGGMNTSVNVVNSPSARRYSRNEMKSRVREDLYR